MGRPSSREIATTMPPLAVPSSFVRMMPVTATAEVNSTGLSKPVLSGGGVENQQNIVRRAGNHFAAVRFIFSSSAIKLDFVCKRPAVSTMTTSAERALAAATAS